MCKTITLIYKIHKIIKTSKCLIHYDFKQGKTEEKQCKNIHYMRGKGAVVQRENKRSGDLNLLYSHFAGLSCIFSSHSETLQNMIIKYGSDSNNVSNVSSLEKTIKKIHL